MVIFKFSEIAANFWKVIKISKTSVIRDFYSIESHCKTFSFKAKMIILILVEIFMLFTFSKKKKTNFTKIPFSRKLLVHGHEQNRYWIKRFVVSNFDLLCIYSKLI